MNNDWHCGMRDVHDLRPMSEAISSPQLLSQHRAHLVPTLLHTIRPVLMNWRSNSCILMVVASVQNDISMIIRARYHDPDSVTKVLLATSHLELRPLCQIHHEALLFALPHRLV